MKNKEYVSIIKMIEYIDKAINYTKEYTFETFSQDDKTIDATIFVISQIGELVKNIQEDTISKHPEIEWKVIKGLRNRIVHDYEGINLKLIWYIIKEDLAELKDKLNNLCNIN